MRRAGFGILTVLLVLSSLASWSPRASAATLVLSGTRIVDVKAGRVLPPSDVQIEGERIVRIAAAGRLRPTGARIVDAGGTYLSPGFWDMHAHVNAPDHARQWLMPMMLASGVTAVRDMAGDCWTEGCEDSIRFMRAMQSEVEAGKLAGPRLVAIGSAVILGPQDREPGMPDWAAPADAQQATRLVHELRKRGVDFIKPYDSMTREAYFAMAREAKKAGLPLGGHVPLSVSTMEALDAGQRTIDHAKHPAFDCSPYTDGVRERYAAWAEQKPGAEAVRMGAYYQPILASYDEKRCAKVIKRMAQSGAYYVPTLITRKFEAFAADPAYLDDARLASVPPRLLADWRADAGRYQERFAKAPAEKQAYMEFYELGVRLVGKAQQAGVRILVGTDVSDSYSFPGSGYHDEFLELSKAGLSNPEILKAATWRAAEFLHRTADFGSVETGKVADLVLLEADPLADIGNARRIRAVVRGGELFDATALRGLEDGAKAFVATLPQPISDIFEEYAGEDRPGCSVGVVRDGRLADSAAFGMADIGKRVPLRPDTVFNIASVSKQFTAFGILLLEQRGKLSIDDPVTKYVPELGGYAGSVTLRHLLHHTGGLRDYYALLRLDGRSLGEPTTREQALRVLSRQRGPNQPPNTRYEYSNTGFFLLGVIIERLSGKPLREFMRESLFEPLGMRSTSIVDHYPDGIAALARGYSAEGPPFSIDESPWEQTGDGQVHTTVEDMARWERNYLTGEIGGLPLLARMQEPITLVSGKTVQYGLGLTLGEYRGLRTVRHGGDWMGYRAHYLRFPEQRFASVVLCNRALVPADRYNFAIADRYLAPAMKQPKPALTDRVGELGIEDDEGGATTAWAPDRLSGYAGRYRSDETTARLEIEVRDGRLVLGAAGKAFPLQPASPDEFSGEGLVDEGSPFTLRFGAGSRGRFELSTDGLRGLRFARQ